MEIPLLKCSHANPLTLRSYKKKSNRLKRAETTSKGDTLTNFKAAAKEAGNCKNFI